MPGKARDSATSPLRAFVSSWFNSFARTAGRLSAADECFVRHIQLAALGVDFAEEPCAVAVVAGGGGDLGTELTPVGVEAMHQCFPQIFAEHRGGGDGKALGFGAF